MSVNNVFWAIPWLRLLSFRQQYHFEENDFSQWQIRYILNFCFKICQISTHRQTVWCCSVRRTFVDLCWQLSEWSKNDEKLSVAVDSGDVSKVIPLISKRGVDPTKVDPKGQTAWVEIECCCINVISISLLNLHLHVHVNVRCCVPADVLCCLCVYMYRCQ